MDKKEKREIKRVVILLLVIVGGFIAVSYFLGDDITRKLEHSGIIICSILVAIGLIRYFLNRKG